MIAIEFTAAEIAETADDAASPTSHAVAIDLTGVADAVAREEPERVD